MRHINFYLIFREEIVELRGDGKQYKDFVHIIWFYFNTLVFCVGLSSEFLKLYALFYERSCLRILFESHTVLAKP